MSATPDLPEPSICPACAAAAERLVLEAVTQALDSVATNLAMMGNPRDTLERREVVRWLRRPSLQRAKTPGEIFDAWTKEPT